MTDIVSTDLPLPTDMADNISPKVAVLPDGTTLSDLIHNAFRATYKWLFGLETVVIVTTAPADEAEEDSTQPDELSVSFRYDNDGRICFLFLDRWFQKIQDKFGVESREVMEEEIHRLACLVLIPQFQDDSYPKKFQQGFSNFVLLREGIPLSPYCGRTTAHVWYGPKMPYFLDWVDKEYGQGTICRLIAALGAPYNKAVFETVTGTSISSLWKRYCVSQGKELSENEELNAEFSELWPMPMLRHNFAPTLEQEWNVIFSNNLEPTGALTKALLATFRHLYTPRTVPKSVIRDFCLVLESAPMQSPIKYKMMGLLCRLTISWDWIKSERPTVATMMEILVLFMIHYYRRLMDSDKIKPAAGDKQTMAAFVLMQEGIVPSRIPGEQRREDNSFIELQNLERADFFCWMETTVGEGTMKKLYKRMSRERFDQSWTVAPTGKSLKELSHEFERIFPPRAMSLSRYWDSLKWQESHIDAIYLDESLARQESHIDASDCNRLQGSNCSGVHYTVECFDWATEDSEV